jgi:penicillin G amidase
MRAVLVIIVTVALVFLLDCPIGSLPALGRLLDPINGCWANAEPVNEDFSNTIHLAALQHGTTVWFDDRLVSHIHAANNHDLYFMEGYIHACFRLWQMDMVSRAAAGRVSEVIGEKAFNFDRKQRRKGMVYAAENSLKAMEADPRTKEMVSAYTDGVNAFIASLRYRSYPLEYKLMGFAPSKWTNINSALLLKYMADDLTGKDQDLSMSYLKGILHPDVFKLFYPETIEGSLSVIPPKTVFEKASLPTPREPADSLFPPITQADFEEKSSDGKGSNNWAVSGARTQSGAAILCNDPHLGLNLPSIWYEVQLQAPGINVYGVSLPGTPGVVIGFNDSISWGFTNNYRDVKDFYLVKPVTGDKNKYWFAGKQLDFAKRAERIAVKGKPDFIDTVDYTIQGPVMYDEHYPTPGNFKKPLAMCWMAHRPTNEMLCIYQLDRAKNYNDFVAAIMHFECPAQNMAYADRGGNIAIWGQGQFVNKWHGQGRFVMNGADSATLWKELIPMRENPHVYNPSQGYVSSANQCVTDSAYPYWYNGYFVELRAWRINQVLSGLQKATVKDMFALQQDTYSILASQTLPIMLGYLDNQGISNANRQKYIDSLKRWNYVLSAESFAATLYQRWWGQFYYELWSPQFKNVPDQVYPLPERTMQLMRADSAINLNIAGKSFHQYLEDAVIHSFSSTVNAYEREYGGKQVAWYMDKNTSAVHLTKLPAFSYDHLKTGGWGNTVNAATSDHGPSWRMVVEMGKEIKAYGVYPGGESGNPGSKFYASFLPYWTEGKYYELQFLPNADRQNNNAIKYTLTANPK